MLTNFLTHASLVYGVVLYCNFVILFQLTGIVPITCEQLFVGIDKKKSSGEDIECQVCLLGMGLLCHSGRWGWFILLCHCVCRSRSVCWRFIMNK